MDETYPIECRYFDDSLFNLSFRNFESSFSAIHVNTRSINNKRDDLEIFFESLSMRFDALLFSETWIHENAEPPYFNDYKCASLGRVNKRGGGVAIYLKQNIFWNVVEHFSVITADVECLVLDAKTVIIAVIYRPPTGNKEDFLRFLEDLLSFLGGTSKPFLIMGDINIDLLKCNSYVIEMKNLLSAWGCTNAVTLPTRVTLETSSSIDICITNLNAREATSGVFTQDISDHMPVFCLTSFYRGKNTPKRDIYSYRRINEESLETFFVLIEQTNWEDVLLERDPNLAYALFSNKFKLCYDAAFPLIQVKNRQKNVRKPWITNDLYRRIKIKDKMYHNFIKCRNQNLLIEFKKTRNKLNSDLKKAKSEYYQNIFSRVYNDPRKIWETVNEITDRKKRVQETQSVALDDRNASGQEMLNLMNMHFVDVGSPPEDEDTSQCCVTDGITSLKNTIMLLPTTPYEVEGLINKIKNNAAAGVDDIKPRPVKYVSKQISYILSHLINRTLETGIFPNELKIARVTPIYKGGGEHLLQNYRPISVLPVFSKIFEGVINSRLDKFFSKHNVLNKCQYGFQKSKSAEQALVEVKDKIINNIENRLYTLGLFLDFRKAFDTIQHDILLIKLQMYGIRGVAFTLIKNYLQNRMQYVYINNNSSNTLKIKYGVPQGSILGPLLFLLYVNDITNILGSPDLVMYADDTNAFFASASKPALESMANKYLDNLSVWLQKNKLQLNVKKTNYIIFAPINRCEDTKVTIYFENKIIEEVTEQKFLGVWFNRELSWNTHVNKLSSELSRVIGCIYKIRNLIPLWLKKNIYYALFYSKLCYCILVWGTTSATNYNRLIILQKKMLRLFENYEGKPQDLSTEPLFNKYGLLKVNQIYCFKLLQIIHTNKLFEIPPGNTTSHALRHRIRRPPKIRTNYGKQTTGFQVAKILNNTENLIDFNCNILLFKKRLKTLLVGSDIVF